MEKQNSHSLGSSRYVLLATWRDVWESAALRAVGLEVSGLSRPSVSLDAAEPLLEFSADAVLHLREKHLRPIAAPDGAGVEEGPPLSVLPLEGASKEFLTQAITEAPSSGSMAVKKAAPGLAEDPEAFLRALVRAALQNGDRGYFFVARDGSNERLDDAKVDALLQQHCGELLASARALTRPSEAAKQLEEALQELNEAFHTPQGLLKHKAAEESGGGGGSEAALRASARRLRLASQLRRVVQSVQSAVEEEDIEVVQAQEEAATTPMELEQGGAATAAAMDVETEEAPPVPEEPQRSQDHGPLERTKSQVVKQLKVAKVEKELEDRKEPLKQLRRCVSLMEKDQAPTPKRALDEEERYKLTAEQLAQVQQMQKKCRNFNEDLMEDMVALDSLSGLHDEDRRKRKQALTGIQSLLDEVDGVKGRLLKSQKQLAAELESLPKPAAPEPPAPAAAAGTTTNGQQQLPSTASTAAAAKPAPLSWPEVDWNLLKLEPRFSARELRQSYVVTATLPGLVEESLKLQHSPSDGALLISGVRVPSSLELEELQRQVRKSIVQNREIWARSEPGFSLTQQHLEELMLRAGQSKFGRFEQRLAVPEDADAETAEASYEDGVLRVVLPKFEPQQAPRGSLHGVPAGGFHQTAPSGFGGMYPPRGGGFHHPGRALGGTGRAGGGRGGLFGDDYFW